MMGIAQHTPTPWSTEAFNEVLAGEPDYASMIIGPDGMSILAQQISDADAQFIVTAVNSYSGRSGSHVPRIPTPAMMAAAWAVIDPTKKAQGIAKLGPGLGVRELWQAMFDAASTDIKEG